MHAIYELYQAMPGKDCGICGSITCRQFARRLAAGEEQPEKCTYLSSAGLQKTENLLREGVLIHRQLPPQEEPFLVQPCLSDSKKIMADSRIGKETKYGVIDTHEMCKLAKRYPGFKKQKCSEKLGVVTFEHDKHEIVLYDNGKISIKQADSSEDAIKQIKETEKIFRASYTCPECGGSAIDCAKGYCRCKMECELLPPKESTGTDTEKTSAEETERAGIGMLADRPRTGILLIALSECMETLAKTGKEETERAENNKECVDRILRKLI